MKGFILGLSISAQIATLIAMTYLLGKDNDWVAIPVVGLLATMVLAVVMVMEGDL